MYSIVGSTSYFILNSDTGEVYLIKELSSTTAAVSLVFHVGFPFGYFFLPYYRTVFL